MLSYISSFFWRESSYKAKIIDKRYNSVQISIFPVLAIENQEILSLEIKKLFNLSKNKEIHEKFYYFKNKNLYIGNLHPSNNYEIQIQLNFMKKGIYELIEMTFKTLENDDKYINYESKFLKSKQELQTEYDRRINEINHTIKFREFFQNTLTNVNILITGFMGSGKSTFLNYIYSILNNTDATITANQIVDQANETNTRHLEGFRVNKNGILNVWDLWGIEAQPEEIKNEEEIQLDEHNITNILDKLLSGKYLKNGILDRDHPIKIEEEEIYDINKRVHSLILVIDLNYRMNMENISQIKTIFKICRKNFITPLIIFTKTDLLFSSNSNLDEEAGNYSLLGEIENCPNLKDAYSSEFIYKKLKYITDLIFEIENEWKYYLFINKKEFYNNIILAEVLYSAYDMAFTLYKKEIQNKYVYLNINGEIKMIPQNIIMNRNLIDVRAELLSRGFMKENYNFIHSQNIVTDLNQNINQIMKQIEGIYQIFIKETEIIKKRVIIFKEINGLRNNILIEDLDQNMKIIDVREIINKNDEFKEHTNIFFIAAHGTPITTYQEQVRPISFIFRTIENDQNCVAIQIADELN